MTNTSAAQSPNDQRLTQEEVLSRFLKEFDQISSRGYVRTLRPGDSGIGFTLETLLAIPENNSPQGDFHGMEIKAYRDSEDQVNHRDKMNLFLKEPEWTDGLKASDRVQRYGYKDPDGRQGWYLSVTNRMNDAGLQLRLSAERDVLELLRNDMVIGVWNVSVLQERLEEKHNHSVFVAAETRGEGVHEEFWFRTVTWCQGPSADRFMQLVDAGDVIVELRMHLHPNGTVRNHGTAFRVRKHRLKDLFMKHQRLRPVATPAPMIHR